MRLTLKQVKSELAAVNVSIHKIEGEYKVYPKGTIGQAYFTDNLEDARGTGLAIAHKTGFVASGHVEFREKDKTSVLSQ